MRHPVSYQIFPIATNCSMHICSKNSGLLDWPPESPDNQYHLFK